MRALPASLAEHADRGVAARKEVAPTAVRAVTRTLTRERRLAIWADALERCGELAQLRELDSADAKSAKALRKDGTALEVAFREPALRAEGLRADTVGAAMEFFGLSLNEAHRMLCECGCVRVQTGARAAAAARRIARARRAHRACLLAAGGLSVALALAMGFRLLVG